MFPSRALRSALLVFILAVVACCAWAFVRHSDLPPVRLSLPSSHSVVDAHVSALPPAPTFPGASPARFVDVGANAGLNYRWTIPGSRPLDILQTIGNGCAFLDYDNDGNLDVLLVGSKLALYKGDGHGRFTDVTHPMGLDKLHGHFLGCAVGDYDNDGYDDIYISGYRTGLLLHNEGGKGFRDVTEAAGLKPQPWGTSCAWADVDGDGRLDLFVGNYVRFDPNKDQRLCKSPEKLISCGPLVYRSQYGVLYHNLGGRFQDVSAQWHPGGWGHTLGAAFADYDHSGHSSLYLANDEAGGNMLKNVGAAFRDVSRESGTAFDGRDRVHGGMGMDWGDYDNDGQPDLFVAAYQNEPKCVYHNVGSGIFEEISQKLTLAQRTTPYVAFGAKWLDYDNDGWLDLMIANGHVEDNVHDVDPSTTYRQPTQLFWNVHGRLLADMSARAGAALQKPIVGRGLAVGDFDNDGRVDALVVDAEGTPLLLHNESRTPNHWLSFTLVGTGPKCNRDGYGAQVVVTAGGLTQTRVCHADGSYLSSSDKRVHVGLGKAGRAQSVTVRWPDGHVDRYADVAGDRGYVAREGSGTLDSRPGRRP